jgi:hypothetical protein
VYQKEQENTMASLGKVTFTSKNGDKHRFKVFPLSTRFRKMGGVFLITRRRHCNQGGYRHKILYIGSTEDFSQPFEAHLKAQTLKRIGANCICVQSDQSQESRQGKQCELIAAFKPAYSG